MSDLPDIPTSGPMFETLIREIDAKLIGDGKDIASRHILAVGEVSRRYQVSIPLGGAVERMPAELRHYAPLSDAIDRWYKETYGDRLKVDPCPGRTVVLLDGDLYILRIPRLYGTVNFVLGRKFLETPSISRGPVTFNIVQLLEDITPRKAAQLSDPALEAIGTAFNRAFPAIYLLQNTSHQLMRIARGDLVTAISNLTDKASRYGESKWASLQLAEKAMKAAISLAGHEFQQTHTLSKLRAQLENAGIVLDAPQLLDNIQCGPGIRYGSENCTRSDALAAHESSLALINSLYANGAKFTSGLGAFPGSQNLS